MIVWDTETTGLVKAKATRLSDQPKIIEFAAIKLDDITLDEVGRIEMLIDPQMPLPEFIVKNIKITDAMVKGKGTFAKHLPAISDFFIGERNSAAHNHAFDSNMLNFELSRLDKLTKFPWPPNQICTVEASYPMRRFRLNLTKLHLELFGKEFASAHRAMADVEALARCTKELIKKGFITLP